MRRDRRGKRSVALSSAVAAVAIIVVLVVGGGAGYYFGISGTSPTTVTSTVKGGSTSTVTSTVTATGSAGLGNLTALAKAEGGTLTIYGLLPTDLFNKFVQTPFNAIYPWVTINYISLNTGGVLSKISQEESAGHVVGDILALPPQAYVSLGKGNLTCFNNASFINTGYPATAVPSGWGCYFGPFQSGLIVIGYNTKLISASSTPKSWLDLANTQYKGTEAIWKPTPGSSWIAALVAMKYYFHMNTTQWKSFLTGIANNNYVRASDFGSAYTDLSTGGAAICVCQDRDVVQGAASGAPVAIDWNVPEIWQFANLLGIPKGAPHLYTAQLFIGWASGYAGQQAIAQSGTVPMLPSLLQPVLTRDGVQGNHTFVSTLGAGYLDSANYTAMNSVVTQILSA